MGVVIPTHDRPRELVRAIRSVQSQTIPVAQIIVVDDSNSDATQSAIDEMSERDPRLCYVRSKGHGAAQSRNEGLARVASRYCAFLDDDDVWLPDSIERMTSRLRESSAAAVFGAIIRRTGTGAKCLAPVLPRRLAHLIERNPGFGGVNGLYDRDALERLGGFDETIPSLEDKELVIRMIGAGLMIVCQPDPVAVVSTSSTARISTTIDHAEATDLLARRYGVELRRHERMVIRLRIVAMRNGIGLTRGGRWFVGLARLVTKLRSIYLMLVYRSLRRTNALASRRRGSVTAWRQPC